MKTFLINLDRSVDRLQFFTEQANALGITFERISAVDGRKLGAEQLRLSLAPTFEFQPINAGEIGLFMSHKQAWQELIASGDPHAAVFEDDAVMAKSMRNVMDAIDHEAGSFEVIKLETTLRRVVCRKEVKLLSSGNTLQKLLSWHGGTAGYVISSACARRLLTLKEKLADPIDQVMFNPMSKVCSQIQILQLNPAVCIQKDILNEADTTAFGTTIDRNVTGGHLFRHGPLIDIRRLVNKQIERQRRRWLALNRKNSQLKIPFESNEQSLRAA